MAYQIVREFVVNIQHSERVPSADGRGFSTSRLPDMQETVEVVVNLEEIVNRLGPKAARSKRGLSRYMDGAVVVALKNRKRR